VEEGVGVIGAEFESGGVGEAGTGALSGAGELDGGMGPMMTLVSGDASEAGAGAGLSAGVGVAEVLAGAGGVGVVSVETGTGAEAGAVKLEARGMVPSTPNFTRS